MYTCPTCQEKFDLVVESKAAASVHLTVVHQHDTQPPFWRAVAYAKGERKSADGKEIAGQNLEMKKVARQKEVTTKRAEKAHGGWTHGPSEEQRVQKVAEYKEWERNRVG